MGNAGRRWCGFQIWGRWKIGSESLDLSARKVIFEPEVSQETSVLQYGALAWSPNGKLLAASAFERGVVVFDLQTEILSHIRKAFWLIHTAFHGHPTARGWSPRATWDMVSAAGE